MVEGLYLNLRETKFIEESHNSKLLGPHYNA